MKTLLKNASQIATFTGSKAAKGKQMNCASILYGADVLLDGDKISAVGKDLTCSAATVFDCTGKTVTAGFIDCHTHFIFDGDRSKEFLMRLDGASYMEIMNAGGGIVNTVTATRKASIERLVGLGKARLDSYLTQGVTTVEGKSGYGLDEQTEIAQLRAMEMLDKTHQVSVVRTYMGAHATPRECVSTQQYVDFVCDHMIPLVAEQKLAEFVDAFCEKNVFTLAQCERILNTATKCGLHTKLHADEIVSLGGSAMACANDATSIEHLLHITDQDIAALGRSETVGVVLPLTAFSLKENFAPVKKMLDSNCAIAVATDFNPGSCFSNSIPMLFALCCVQMKMSVMETLCALTLNAAAAINRADSIGTLEPGKNADIAVWDIPSIDYFAYNFGVNHAYAVFKKGRLAYIK